MTVINNIVFCTNDNCTIRDKCLRVKPKGVALFGKWQATYRQDEDAACKKFVDKTEYQLSI
jgi:hypothetical protein